MPKKNLYSSIETVDTDKKKKSLFDGKVKHLHFRKKQIPNLKGIAYFFHMIFQDKKNNYFERTV